jgi:hypothetical protein
MFKGDLTLYTQVIINVVGWALYCTFIYVHVHILLHDS